MPTTCYVGCLRLLQIATLFKLKFKLQVFFMWDYWVWLLSTSLDPSLSLCSREKMRKREGLVTAVYSFASGSTSALFPPPPIDSCGKNSGAQALPLSQTFISIGEPGDEANCLQETTQADPYIGHTYVACNPFVPQIVIVAPGGTIQHLR